MIWLDFNKSLIIKGFLGALAFFAPIVFAYFDITQKWIMTLLFVISMSPFFVFNRKELFWMGAFSGIIWFYWVGFSLYYFDLLYLFPLMLIFAFFYYGLLFWLVGFLSERFHPLRILIVAFVFDYLSPLGFDWMKPEIFLGYTYFGASKIDLLLTLAAISILLKAKKLFKPLSIVIFGFAIEYSGANIQMPPLAIELVSTNVSQDDKWDDKFKERLTGQNFEYIDRAIAKKADFVVLPETAFPYMLDKSPYVLDELKQRSYDIAILTGALREENGRIYNSSFLFKDGQVEFFDKVVAVPFGEKNPLPKFMSNIVNKLFFNGAEDYKTAQKPSDFEVNGVKFRNAICYEATNDKLFEQKPKYMIVTSNNAWFVPSMEPVMQKMLMTYFAKKYKTTIFHATNKTDSVVIQAR